MNSAKPGRVRSAVLLVALVGSWMLGVPSAAAGDSMTWVVQSKHPNIVSFKLYSSDRKGHVWPSGGKVWKLDDYDRKNIKIQCLGGEKVCYGAWLTGDQSTYWGKGAKAGKGCKSCCFSCNGSATRPIVFGQ